MKINGLLRILLSILPISVLLCACVRPHLDDTMPSRTFSRIPKPKPIIVKDLSKKEASKENTEDKAQKVVNKEEEALSLIWPLKGKVVRAFKSVDEEGKKSSGIILTASPNAPIRSAMNGIVAYAGPHKKFLNALVIANGNIKVAYGYLEGPLPVPGSRISAGQIVGTVSGKKGKAVLYLAVQKDGVAVNPLDYLP